MDTFLWLLKLSSILFFFAPAAELGVIFALTYASTASASRSLTTK